MAAIASNSQAASATGTRLTTAGLCLAAVALLVGGSAFRSLRIEFGGALVHPYLVPLPFVFAAFGLTRLRRFPSRTLVWLGLFVVLYLLSMLQVRIDVSELLKVLASLTTLLAAALVVRTRRDVEVVALALLLSIGVMSLRALLTGSIGIEGLNPLEGVANKNAFSLYALPPLLLGSAAALDQGRRLSERVLAASVAMVLVIAVFATANRSGWLGVALIAVMLLGATGQIRAAIFLAVVALGAYVFFVDSTHTAHLTYKWEQTVEGYQSDQKRWDLFRASAAIGLENPLLGVSPRQLPFELARRVPGREFALDPHNVFGHVLGGSGIPAFIALCAVGASLLRLAIGHRSPRELHAGKLLVMLLLLWVVRGLFTREILYAPAFSLALGLCVGLLLIERREAQAGTLGWAAGSLAAAVRRRG